MTTKEKLFEIEQIALDVEALAIVLTCFTQSYEDDYAKGLYGAHLISAYLLNELGKIMKMFEA